MNQDDSQYLALKKIKIDPKIDNGSFPLTALREIRLLKQLDHENVVKLKKIITTKANKSNNFRGSFYLMFEYLNYDLQGLIEKRVQLNMSEIKCIMKQILQGVQYIHSKHILHRDIKGANILISDEGIVKLADFGLARDIYPKSPQKNYTTRVVTQWYRAPEIIYGMSNYSYPIDVWSIGCVFAEMFSKFPLFPGKDESDQIEKIYEKCGGMDEKKWGNIQSLANWDKHRPRQGKVYKRLITSELSKFTKDQNIIELIDSMLQINPNDRITIQQALDHKAFKEGVLPCYPAALLSQVTHDIHDYTTKHEVYGHPITKYELSKNILNHRLDPKNIWVPENSLCISPKVKKPQNAQQCVLNSQDSLILRKRNSSNSPIPINIVRKETRRETEFVPQNDNIIDQLLEEDDSFNEKIMEAANSQTCKFSPTVSLSQKQSSICSIISKPVQVHEPIEISSQQKIDIVQIIDNQEEHNDIQSNTNNFQAVQEGENHNCNEKPDVEMINEPNQSVQQNLNKPDDIIQQIQVAVEIYQQLSSNELLKNQQENTQNLHNEPVQSSIQNLHSTNTHIDPERTFKRNYNNNNRNKWNNQYNSSNNNPSGHNNYQSNNSYHPRQSNYNSNIGNNNYNRRNQYNNQYNKAQSGDHHHQQKYNNNGEHYQQYTRHNNNNMKHEKRQNVNNEKRNSDERTGSNEKEVYSNDRRKNNNHYRQYNNNQYGNTMERSRSRNRGNNINGNTGNVSSNVINENSNQVKE